MRKTNSYRHIFSHFVVHSLRQHIHGESRLFGVGLRLMAAIFELLGAVVPGDIFDRDTSASFRFVVRQPWETYFFENGKSDGRPKS